MSYIYYQDYKTSDYWDPVLYPTATNVIAAINNNLLYTKIKDCVDKTPEKIHKFDEQETIQYCDLTPIIKKYNEFIKTFIIKYNAIVKTYDEMQSSFLKLKTGTVEVDKWIDDVRRFQQGDKKFQMLNFHPLEIDVKHLMVCDKIYKILELIRTDVDYRTSLLQSLAKLDIETSTDLWNKIYNLH